MLKQKLNLSAFQQVNTGGRPLNKKISLNCYVDVEEILEPYSLVFFITGKHSSTKSNITLKMTITESDLNHEINNYLNNKIITYPCCEISSKIENVMSQFMKSGKPPSQIDLITWILHRSEIQLYNDTVLMTNTHNNSNDEGSIDIGGIDDDLKFNPHGSTHHDDNKDGDEDDYNTTLGNKLTGDICFGGFGHTETTLPHTYHNNDDDGDYSATGGDSDLEGASDSDDDHLSFEGVIHREGDNKIKTMKDYLNYNSKNTTQLKNTLKPNTLTLSTSTKGYKTGTTALKQTEYNTDTAFMTQGLVALEQTGKDIKATLAERKKTIEIDKIRKQQKLQKLDSVKLHSHTINLGVTSADASQLPAESGIGTSTGLFVSKDPDKKMIIDILNNQKMHELLQTELKKQKAKSQREQQQLLWSKAPLAFPILRGKYKKGAYLGEGPLPSQLVHPFKFADSRDGDYYWDSSGRKHAKHAGDEDEITRALEATQGPALADRDLTATAKEIGIDEEVIKAAMEQFKDDTKKSLLIIKRASANIAAYKLSLKVSIEFILYYYLISYVFVSLQYINIIALLCIILFLTKCVLGCGPHFVSSFINLFIILTYLLIDLFR